MLSFKGARCSSDLGSKFYDIHNRLLFPTNIFPNNQTRTKVSSAHPWPWRLQHCYLTLSKNCGNAAHGSPCSAAIATVSETVHLAQDHGTPFNFILKPVTISWFSVLFSLSFSFHTYLHFLLLKSNRCSLQMQKDRTIWKIRIPLFQFLKKV